MKKISMRLSSLKNLTFSSYEDYRKYLQMVNDLQNELVDLYENENIENKHFFVQANFNYLLYTADKIKREIKRHCYIVFNYDIILKNAFDFSAYLQKTTNIYKNKLNVPDFLNLSENIRFTIRKQDEILEKLDIILSACFIEFEKEPISPLMPHEVHEKINTLYQDWINLFAGDDFFTIKRVKYFVDYLENID